MSKKSKEILAATEVLMALAGDLCESLRQRGQPATADAVAERANRALAVIGSAIKDPGDKNTQENQG